MSGVLSPRIKFGTRRRQVATLRERRLYIGSGCGLNDVETENSLILTQTNPQVIHQVVTLFPFVRTFFLRLCQ
jgi:hypothetical protein